MQQSLIIIKRQTIFSFPATALCFSFSWVFLCSFHLTLYRHSLFLTKSIKTSSPFHIVEFLQSPTVTLHRQRKKTAAQCVLSLSRPSRDWRHGHRCLKGHATLGVFWRARLDFLGTTLRQSTPRRLHCFSHWGLSPSN